jgi:hypothetical protein
MTLYLIRNHVKFDLSLLFQDISQYEAGFSIQRSFRYESFKMPVVINLELDNHSL